MEKLGAEMENVNLSDVHEIKNGFALVIVNETFDYSQERKGAGADRENIMRFCEKAGFTINNINGLQLEQTNDLKSKRNGGLKTDNLKKKQMDNLFKTISKGNFESYDAFICFISSHGNKGGILGIDSEPTPVQYIVDQFKASEMYPSLINKPKLFFIQNCRGVLKDSGVDTKLGCNKDDEAENDAGTENDENDGDENDGDDESDDDDESDSPKIPMTIPTTADVLVAYSTVNRYESRRNVKEGSWFITVLTDVLENHAENTNLTDMLATVNKRVAEKESRSGKKQMPCFTSTLRKRVFFKMPPTVSPKL